MFLKNAVVYHCLQEETIDLLLFQNNTLEYNNIPYFNLFPANIPLNNRDTKKIAPKYSLALMK